MKYQRKNTFQPGHKFSTKHGHYVGDKPSPTYSSWHAMMQRCTKPNSISWKRYGGRGIKVCKRWRDSFENFLADMGERPAGKTLDRFPNNDGNYEPGNCRWGTAHEQHRGHTKLCAAGVVLLRYMARRGERYGDLASAFGIKPATTYLIATRRQRNKNIWDVIGMEGLGGLK